MNDPRLVWVLFAPLTGAVLSVLFAQPFPPIERLPGARWWLNLLSLLTACGGLLAQAALLLQVASGGTYALAGLDLALESPPAARLGVLAVDAALLCALLVGWTIERGTWARMQNLVAVFCSLAASLLACALLSGDRLVAVLCLSGAALPVAVLAGLPHAGREDDVEQARRLAGGLKQLSLAIVAAGLLLAGGLMLGRYPLNLESTGTLQVALGLLAVGLAVRVGAMPFSASANDLLEGAPLAAIAVLGAVVPATLVVGVLILAPFQANLDDVSQAGRQAAIGLGLLGALLAGLRALAIRTHQERERSGSLSVLVGASAALQIAWALFGALSGTREGTLGAALLAANLALVVPLLSIVRRWRPGLVVGAASLLGLPPFGGFAGTLLIAQGATDLGGVWTAGLLLGSALVAAAWLNFRQWLSGEEDAASQVESPPLRLLAWTLVVAQVALFALAIPITRALGI